MTLEVPAGGLVLVLDSDAAEFGGTGRPPAPRALDAGPAVLDLAPYHVLVYVRTVS
jgi:hypothetical protein